MKQQRAFSLVELLIYISLISVISLVISTAFITFSRGRGQVEAKGEVNSNLNFAIEKISQDLRLASAVTTPLTAGSTSSGTLVATVSGSTITYCIVSNQLRRQAGAGSCDSNSPTITSPNVIISAANFTRLENTNSVLSKTMVSIEADLQASYNSTSPDWQYSEQKETTVILP